MRRIVCFIVFFCGQSCYAQLGPTSQFSAYYLPAILNLVKSDTINYQIDTSYLQDVYANDARIFKEEILRFSNIKKLDQFSLIRSSSTFITTYLRDSLENYSEFIIKAVRYYLGDRNNYKYTQWGYGYDIITLGALVELPVELKDSLLQHEHLPLKVRARLGDQVALDSIIKDFKRSYRDTVYCQTPTVNYTEQLLYINSKQSINALVDMLSNNIYLYIRKEDWMQIDSLPRWSIVSSNSYILNEIARYYEYDPCRFFDRYTYKPLYSLPQRHKNGFLTTNFTVTQPYMRYGTVIFTAIWSDYLKHKFNRDVNIDFGNLYVWLECQITPPPYLLKDSNYLILLVNNLFPKTFQYSSEYQDKLDFRERCERTLRKLDLFYRDIWFRDDCQSDPR